MTLLLLVIAWLMFVTKPLSDPRGLDDQRSVFRPHEFRFRRFRHDGLRTHLAVGASALIVQHREHLIYRVLIIRRSSGLIDLRNRFDERPIPINLTIREIRMKILHRPPNLRQPHQPGDPRIFL
jgi:hypothetical protein